MEQLNSLTAQISGLTRLVDTVETWRLVDIYIDIASGKSKSQTGKDKWNKRTIEMTLTKRKYIGEAELLKSDENITYYLVSDNNPAILSKEVFEVVQKRKTQRSNITVDENGKRHRSANKYSSKKK